MLVNQCIILKTVNIGKENLAFILSKNKTNKQKTRQTIQKTVPPGNQILDEAKFLYIEIF